MLKFKNLVLVMLQPFIRTKVAIRQLKLFIFQNFPKIFNKRIHFKDGYPRCYQSTKITGTGSVYIGSNCSFGYKDGGFHHGGRIEFQTRNENAKIVFGNNISTNNNIFLCAENSIQIGDDTLIGQYVTIMDFEAHGTDPSKRRQLGDIGTVIIGKNVWIGNNVTILKNVEIGDNSIIGVGAIVTGTFPANVIIGGVPAKKIRDL